ncbi:MAG: PriCT-2 domain-containing protein [Venatoribacter sp.]
MNNSLLKILSALDYLDSSDREVWIKVGMAIKSEFGNDGYDTWLQWSQTAHNYEAAAAKSSWKSFKANGGINIGTPFYLANQNGWRWEGDYQSPSTLERACQLQQQSIENEKAKQAKNRTQMQAAHEANRLWNQAQPVDPKHPYLIQKGIPPYSLRQLGESLLVPISVNKRLVNLQFIDTNGRKRFLTGGQTKGAYCAIAGRDEYIYLCEGWATGSTIHHLTKRNVACAMSAGNLLNAGLAVLITTPNARLIVAADNDWQKPVNTGLEAARATAKRLNARLVYPKFLPNEIGTDFNDHYLLNMSKEAVYDN